MTDAEQYHRIHRNAYEHLRSRADAYTLSRSPLSPLPPEEQDLLRLQRDNAIRQARIDQVLSVQEISQATGLTRQTVYALSTPPPAHMQLPETAV